MKSMLRRIRYLVILALALCAAGCTFRLDLSKLEECFQELLQEAYLQAIGPMVVTSCVGMAAPPGGWGAVSALGADATWRHALQQGLPPPPDPVDVAGAVGAAAAPGGWGALWVLRTVAHTEDQRDPFLKPEHLPSVFAVQTPDKTKGSQLRALVRK